MTGLKRQAAVAWLQEVSRVPGHPGLRHLERALRHFFAGQATYPTLKKKRGRQSATSARAAFTWDGNALTLATLETPLDSYGSRPLPTDAQPSTIPLAKDTAGRSCVSFRVEEDRRPLDVAPRTVGIDRGGHDVVTLATGEKTGTATFCSKDEKRLATLPRRHATPQKRSQNREKARRQVARIHARIADRRRDFLHKLTTRLVHDNQVMCVESLRVKNMLQNHGLAKAIADVGWGELVRQVQYKAAWDGRDVVALDTWYPSSKRCHVCGHLLDSLALDVRQWTCPACGTLHDRDINAALHIKAEGLSVLACGGAVRPGRVKSVRARSREAGSSSR